MMDYTKLQYDILYRCTGTRWDFTKANRLAKALVHLIPQAQVWITPRFGQWEIRTLLAHEIW